MSKRMEKMVARLMGLLAGIVALLSTIDSLEKYELFIVGAAYLLSQTAAEMGGTPTTFKIPGVPSPLPTAAASRQSEDAIKKP